MRVGVARVSDVTLTGGIKGNRTRTRTHCRSHARAPECAHRRSQSEIEPTPTLHSNLYKQRVPKTSMHQRAATTAVGDVLFTLPDTNMFLAHSQNPSWKFEIKRSLHRISRNINEPPQELRTVTKHGAMMVSKTLPLLTITAFIPTVCTS